MFFLLFVVCLIQIFTYWIFEPLTSFLQYILEIKLLPLIALVGFIWLFSARNILKIK